MIEKITFNGVDFKAVLDFEGWRIGLLRFSDRFSKFDRLERHLLTDEAFILLDGKATLYTETEQVEMQKCVIYNIPKGEWHHITVDETTMVMVVENSNTCDENTQIKFIKE